MSFNLEVHLPILIGSIPPRNTFANFVPQQPAIPSVPVIPSQVPALPPINVPAAPPPSMGFVDPGAVAAPSFPSAPPIPPPETYGPPPPFASLYPDIRKFCIFYFKKFPNNLSSF